jgi:hypothetical protein
VGVASLGNAYWQKRYNGARRLVGILPALMPSLITRAEASAPIDSAPTEDDAAIDSDAAEDQQP